MFLHYVLHILASNCYKLRKRENQNGDEFFRMMMIDSKETVKRREKKKIEKEYLNLLISSLVLASNHYGLAKSLAHSCSFTCFSIAMNVNFINVRN